MSRVALVIGVAVLGLVGCNGRSATDARRQRWESERRGLLEQLEQLEERLLTDQARVHFWQQMQERHESASAVACTNLGRHAESIAALDEQQREKRDALARKNRLAARAAPRARTTQ